MKKKYWLIITNEIQRQFTWRFNIAAYAFGNIAELISLIVIWSVVYESIDSIKGYSSQEMIGYVVFSWLFAFLTTSYAFEQKVGEDIRMGTLSNFLVKPIGYIRYMIALSLGRSFIAFLVVILQGILVVYIFNDAIASYAIDLKTSLLLVMMLIVAYFINLFLAILIGLISFWTTEVSGINFSVKVFIKLMSGSYFPINLLPIVFMKVSFFFPFVYTIFVPVQLYLGKISFMEGLRGLAIEIAWLFVLYGIIKLVWKFGLKKYESVGI